MDGLPTFPGLDVLSEVGRVGRTVRYRLASTREFLVLFDAPADAAAVGREAAPYLGLSIEGLCPVESVVRHEGRVGVVVRGELGENPWQQPAWGEADALPVVRRAASVVAALHARGIAHGALKPDGLRLLPEGEVEVLPPVVLPEPSDRSLSAEARDLSDLAALACHLIAGEGLLRPAGLSALPAAVTERSSPATAQAIRLVLEAAAAPSVSSAATVELLRRIGWAREVAGPARPPAFPAATPSKASAGKPAVAEISTPAPPRRASSAAGAAGAPASAAGRRERPERTPSGSAVPIAVAVGLVVIGGALFVAGNPDTAKRFWSGASAPKVAALPTPKDPLAGGNGEPKPSRSAVAPPAATSAPATTSDAASTALADQIIAELAERRAQNAARSSAGSSKGKSYDRTLLDEGDALRAAAQELLVTVRDGGLPPAKKNEKLEEAIKKLEAAREKYEGFAEQHPSRQRLVEGSIEDVNSLLFFAYRSKTTG